MDALATQSNLITGEEFLRMGDQGPCELIDGVVVKIVPVGAEHGFIEFNLGGELRSFVRSRKLGWVMGGEVGLYVKRNPDRVRGADIVFVSNLKQQIRPTAGYLEEAPDLVVEVVSPNDSQKAVDEKIAEYFQIGVARVWIVESKKKTVAVYRSAHQMTRLGQNDVLIGEGRLSGFSMTVRDIFE